MDGSGRLLAADDGRALPDRRDRRDGHHARHCVAWHLALLLQRKVLPPGVGVRFGTNSKQ